MATPPRSAKGNRPGSAASAARQSQTQKKGVPTGVWVLIAVAVLIIGAVVVINNNNESKARALAAAKKKNAEIARKNAEIAQKAQEERERRKREKEERMAAAAREAEEAEARRQAEAAAQKAAETTPEPQPEVTPDEDDETPDNSDSGSEEEATDTEAEEEAEEAPKLKLTGKATKKALMAFGEVVTSYTKEKDYEGLRSRMLEELKTAFPKEFGEEEVDLFAIKLKPAMGKRALTICQALELADATRDEKIIPDEDKFLAWLIGAKKSPALDFCTALEKHKVDREMAESMMQDMRAAYKNNPRSAAQKARTFANPMFAGPSKKLYPRDKKEIGKTLEELLNSPPANGADVAQQQAVNMCNAFRYLCDVPPHVIFSKEYQKEAQEAAVTCRKAGQISHGLGHFTDKCNLHMGTSEPVLSVKAYVHDAGENNREKRGHRAWILNAGTQKTAFGVDGIFQAQRTMDNSFAPRPEGGYGYPGRGFFPSEYLLGDGWSYYAGPDFKIDDSTKVQMWLLSSHLKSNPTADQLKKATAIPIMATFRHTAPGAPLQNSLVFEPDYSKFRTDKDGRKIGTYWVVISSGGAKIEYVVDLF